MQKLSSTLIAAGMLLIPSICRSQSVSTSFDQKVIYADSLHLPASTSVMSALKILPELLQRPGDYIFDNYDIQIDGLSVGGAADVAVEQLMLSDVQRLEVSESPTQSYSRNGQGGVINIIPRQLAKNDDDFHGSAGVSAEYNYSIAPQCNLHYKKNKLYVKGLMLTEFFGNTPHAITSVYNSEECVEEERNSADEKFTTQLARAYINYALSPKDVFNLNLSESFTRDRTNTSYSTGLSERAKDIETSLHALANYTHNFSRSSLFAEMQFVFSPGSNRHIDTNSHDYKSDYHTNNIMGKIEYKTPLLPTSNESSSSLLFFVGCAANNQLRDDTKTNNNADSPSLMESRLSTSSHTFNLMPYSSLEGRFGKFNFKAIIEYQHYLYSTEKSEEKSTKAINDFTGKLITEWNFSKNNTLRLILDRKNTLPTEDQLFPYMTYNPQSMSYMMGNSSLAPMRCQECSIDYIMHHNWGRNSLTLNTAVSYNMVENVITEINTSTSPGEGMLGLSQEYLTYINGEHTNIINGNLMALYAYKGLSMSLVGNIYHSHQSNSVYMNNHYTNFNISFIPSMNLKSGWTAKTDFTYYSKVSRHYQTLSDCVLATTILGKTWRSLFVYAYGKASLSGTSRDVVRTSDDQTQYTNYRMVRNCVGAGIKIRF